MAGSPQYQPCLHVVLVAPEIPQNAGNIGRTCVAVGAKLWMVRPLGFRLDDYYLRRAGLDYWPFLEWEVVDDWDALVERLPTSAMWYFTKTAARSYASACFAAGDVLVFGSESQGLPATLLAGAGERKLLIPMRSPIRSLNLANTAAIVLYEALRQGVEPPV
jgi:tRNA (cytidine/uridine-2'-O-)-methyltransferase